MGEGAVLDIQAVLHLSTAAIGNYGYMQYDQSMDLSVDELIAIADQECMKGKEPKKFIKGCSVMLQKIYESAMPRLDGKRSRMCVLVWNC